MITTTSHRGPEWRVRSYSTRGIRIVSTLAGLLLASPWLGWLAHSLWLKTDWRVTIERNGAGSRVSYLATTRMGTVETSRGAVDGVVWLGDRPGRVGEADFVIVARDASGAEHVLPYHESSAKAVLPVSQAMRTMLEDPAPRKERVFQAHTWRAVAAPAVLSLLCLAPALHFVMGSWMLRVDRSRNRVRLTRVYGPLRKSRSAALSDVADVRITRRDEPFLELTLRNKEILRMPLQDRNAEDLNRFLAGVREQILNQAAPE